MKVERVEVERFRDWEREERLMLSSRIDLEDYYVMRCC